MGERPIECSGCNKPLCTTYKEIVGETCLVSEMCKDCPVLEEKLHGKIFSAEKRFENKTLVCSSCGTSLDEVRMGGLLGCKECYTVFSELLFQELLKSNVKFSLKKSPSLHLGRSPKTTACPPSSRLAELSEALSEALKKENYEQAVWLRDQIKQLKGL